MEDDVIAMQDIFSFNARGVDAHGRVVGAFTLSGIRPRILETLQEKAMAIPPELAKLFPASGSVIQTVPALAAEPLFKNWAFVP